MKSQDYHPTWNGYLLRLQQEAPKPKPVICQRKKIFENRPPFYGDEYHGLISREEADALCSEEGNFLIKESQTEPGRFTLVLKLLENVKNFKLYYEDGKHYVGEKRFDSVYSLVEDGIITMYIESKGRDFIETMAREPVYNSLSRYSSIGSKHGATPVHSSQHCQLHHFDLQSHVECLTYQGAECGPCQCSQSPQTHRPGCEGNDSNYRPGYVPRTILESSCYPHDIANLHYAQNHQSHNHRVYQAAPADVDSNGGHKKMLTPTSSDERKRVKKRIATEDRILMRAASNKDFSASLPDQQQSSFKPNSFSQSTGFYHYKAIEEAQSDRITNSQYLNLSPQHQHSSQPDPRLLEMYTNQTSSSQRITDVITSGSKLKRSIKGKKSIATQSNKDFSQSQRLYHSPPFHQSISPVQSDVDGVTYLDSQLYEDRPAYNNVVVRHDDALLARQHYHRKDQQQNAVESLFHRDGIDSNGSCESSLSNLSSGMDRPGTSSSRYTHDSHPTTSEDDVTLPSARHRGLLRCSSASPQQSLSHERKEISSIKKLEEDSPWKRRSEVEERSFGGSRFSSSAGIPQSSRSILNTSHTKSDIVQLKMKETKDKKRERRNSFDTSTLSRDNKIAIQPVVQNKKQLNRTTSAAPHPAIQKSKSILRRVSSFGVTSSKRGSPTSTPSRKGSVKEKSNKSKQSEENKASPQKFKKSHSLTSSPCHQSGVTSGSGGQSDMTSSSKCNFGKSILAQQYEKQHQYKSHTYRGLQWCEYCGNFMWGIIQQGVQCRDCGLNVHKQCSKLVPNDCQPALKHVKHVFGVDLTTLVKLHGTQRPLVVDMCIEEIEKKGMDSLGIYRISGCLDDVTVVKSAFDQYGEDIDVSTEQDINTIAGVLKLYLRELPVPLIPYQLYSRFINAAKLSHQDGKLNAFRMGLSAMPESHLQTLKYLIFHLGRVSERSLLNQMPAHNLGLVFGPTLLRAPVNVNSQTYNMNDTHYQQQTIETMIEYRHHLFLAS